MPFNVAVGWDVVNAIASPRLGRLTVAIPGFTVDNRAPSYPGFNGYTVGGTQFLADSTRTALAIVKWLTGKTTGANILACTPCTPETPFLGYEYGLEWQAAITGAGHSITITGSASSWAGFEPLDYDLLCMGPTLSAFSYRGLTTAQEKVDFVLSNKGAILGTIGGVTPVWAEYGITYAGTNHPDLFTGLDFGHHVHSTTYGPEAEGDGWQYQIPFAAYERLGNPGVGGSWSQELYAYTYPHNEPAMTSSTNNRGGNSIVYFCAEAEDKSLYEDHYNATGYTGALGFWWL